MALINFPDTEKGNGYGHWHQWVEYKLMALAGIFALNISAYAIIPTHYHLMFHRNGKK